MNGPQRSCVTHCVVSNGTWRIWRTLSISFLNFNSIQILSSSILEGFSLTFLFFSLCSARIVEKNPTKFRIDNRELSSRRHFIDNTRDEVKQMKDKMSLNRNRDRDITAHQPLLENERNHHHNSNHHHITQSNEYNNHHHHQSHNDRTYLVDCPNSNSQSQSVSVANTIAGTMSAAAAAAAATRHSGTKYSKLENALDVDSPSHYGGNLDSPGHRYVGETVSIQQRMIQGQDEQLDMISDSIGTLKTVSRQIGVELDEQAVMLDDFGNEFDTTESKLDTTMKKVAKVLHMNNGRLCRLNGDLLYLFSTYISLYTYQTYLVFQISVNGPPF